MNKNRAREIAKIIRDHSELWDQSSWVSSGTFDPIQVDAARTYLEQIKLDLDPDTNLCGTTGCVAGWAAMLYAPSGSVIASMGTVVRLPKGYTYCGEESPQIDGFAENMLNLDPIQSSWLFSGVRDQEQVLWALENDDENWDPGDCPFADTYDDDLELTS